MAVERDAQGLTALARACAEGKTEAVGHLLETASGLEALEIPTPDGKTPLVLAVELGVLPIALKLIKHGANLWYVGPDGKSVFQSYCRGKDNVALDIEALRKMKAVGISTMKRTREKYIAQQGECCQRCSKKEWTANYNDPKFTSCRCNAKRMYCSDACKKADWRSGHYKTCFTDCPATYQEDHKYRQQKARQEIVCKAKVREDRAMAKAGAMTLRGSRR